VLQRNCPLKIFWVRASYMVSATVLLDRALLSSYKLSIVTMPLSVTVCLQFMMQILSIAYR